MPRADRAKQFAPFDALKGLQNALRIKEYEHERVEKGDLQEEQIQEISKTLLSPEKGNIVKIKYFDNGHYLIIEGNAKLILESKQLQINNKKINLDDIFEIDILR